MSAVEKSPGIFYGWFVVTAAFALTIVLGATNWSFGVFFKPLMNEFGWSRTVVSSSYTAFLIGVALSAVIMGRLADRYSPRAVLLACAVLAGLGTALSSQIQDINQLRFFLFLAGLGIGANWTVPATSIQRWFYGRKRAGLALGIVASGVGVGALIFAPVINYLILGYGWRNAYLIIGIIFFSLMVASSLVIRRSPAVTGTVSEEEAGVTKSVSTQDWTTGRAVATPSFLAITFIISIGVMSFYVVSVHLIPHATDVGISSTTSATAIGLMGGFSIPGRIMGGLISDRVGWQKILALAAFGMGLSMLWLIFLKTTWMLYAFVFSYGIFQGSRVPPQAGIFGDFFGMRALGALIGITFAISVFIGAFAPYIAGFIFDTTGSYFWAFIIVMVLLFVAGLVATMIKKPLITLK